MSLTIINANNAKAKAIQRYKNVFNHTLAFSLFHNDVINLNQA